MNTLSRFLARMLVAAWSLTLGASPQAHADEPPTITLTSPPLRIERSCRIVIPDDLVTSDDGAGIIRIVADNITVEFVGASTLRGTPIGAPGERVTGTGIALINRKNVTIRNARVAGFAAGIHAVQADGLTIEHCTFTDGRRMNLKSDAAREDQSDWLWPHKNDAGEWLTTYGSAICVERSRGITISNCTVRTTQNGIMLREVNDSTIIDNDASFLSGWGLSMWRSSRNLVCRNAFDFCIRGYSHGVYNRGQDSAGILAFEQCNANTFALNSATHCGDGFFAFAGKEALGETRAPEGFDYSNAGCNDNLFIDNDFSYAAAHGLEITFSKGNRIARNRLVGNAICGVWAGYCADTLITENTITDNGLPNAREGGGINIEHGRRNTIFNNTFARNTQAISLWWDPDESIAKLPWAKANGVDSADNRILLNAFENEPLAVRLVKTRRTTIGGNKHAETVEPLKKDAESDVLTVEDDDARIEIDLREPASPPGTKSPVGARRAFGGREAIIMTSDGPWDFATPLVRLAQSTDEGDEFELFRLPMGTAVDVLNPPGTPKGKGADGEMKPSTRPGRPQVLLIRASGDGVWPYTLKVHGKLFNRSFDRVLVNAAWSAEFFALMGDPTKDLANFAPKPGTTVATTLRSLNLPFGNAGPSELKIAENVTAAKLPRDWFGVVATTSLPLPAGRWRVRVTSDDGVEVHCAIGAAEMTPLIRNFTHHGPTTDTAEFTVPPPIGGAAGTTDVKFKVNYFEMNGYAVLKFEIEPVK